MIKSLLGANRKLQRSSELLSFEQMQDLVDEERLRSERSGLPFSLLLMSPSRSSRHVRHAAHKLSLLGEFMSGRLRTIDKVGFWKPGVLAAVLPYTSPEGAWRVADDAESYCLDIDFDIDCSVYAYPTPKLDDFNATPDGAAVINGRAVFALDTLLCKASPLWKRSLDVLASAVGLIATAPIVGMAIAAVKLESSGPVFYAQWRRGLGGRPFLVYKIRSMYIDADERKAELLASNEQDGPAFKIVKDPRITHVGRVIRATSIDELPQLWNVLRGEMSMVGPRPLPCDEADGCEPWQARRHDVVPGITCYWQTRKEKYVPFARWMRMDLKYLTNASFWTDIKLILKTIPSVLLRSNAS